MSTLTHDQILNDLASMLKNFHGREYDGEITPQTLFFGDLGLASIDAVVLGETIEDHYGRKVPFDRFLAELGQRAVRDIEMNELAGFLHRHLN